MKPWEKLWKIIDGNKTIICMFVLYILKLDSVGKALSPDLILALNWIFALGTGASAVHHFGVKGKHKTTEN